MTKFKLPIWINKEDFEKILMRAKKDRDIFYKPRVKRYTPRGKKINQYILAMVLGFGAGLRISEIVGLDKIQNYTYAKNNKEPVTKQIVSKIPRLTIDKIQDSFIRIYGKGQKERTTIFPSKILLRAGITRLKLKELLPIGEADGQCYRALQAWFNKLTKKVLGKQLHFHCLRHSFASILAGSGKPLHEVQALTGHSRLDTLGIYTHANPIQTIKGVEEMFE